MPICNCEVIGERFCSYDGGDSGQCKDCVDIPGGTLSGCDQWGLSDAGSADCHKWCFHALPLAPPPVTSSGRRRDGVIYLIGLFNQIPSFDGWNATYDTPPLITSPPPPSPPSPPDHTIGSTITLAGSSEGFNDGNSTSARFFKPTGVAIDPEGEFVLVAVRAWPASPRRALPRAPTSQSSEFTH